MTQTLKTERLKQIASGDAFICTQDDESVAMARELLANREAQPVGFYTTVSGRKGVVWHNGAPEDDTAIFTAPPAPAVPDGVMPGGLVYSSALPKFESNDSDKIVGYRCFISGDTRIVESQEQAYADAKAVINACRAAMLVQPVSQGYKLVPVEPTPKQWAAGVKAMDSGMDKVTLVYKAMLATAPTQGESQ